MKRTNTSQCKTRLRKSAAWAVEVGFVPNGYANRTNFRPIPADRSSSSVAWACSLRKMLVVHFGSSREISARTENFRAFA